MLDYHIFTKPVFRDNRGYFIEQFNFLNAIPKFTVKQISESVSRPFTFRGFHFQVRSKMNKIMRVLVGNANIYLLNLTLDTAEVSTVQLSALIDGQDSVQYLYVPSYYAVGFFSNEHTHMQYFHDEPRSEFSRTINRNSVIDQLPQSETVQHISSADAAAPGWAEWKSMNEGHLI
jgi:dTDP-4-dehydrorhamnose 3,5-epimerase-like enzyme